MQDWRYSVVVHHDLLGVVLLPLSMLSAYLHPPVPHIA